MITGRPYGGCGFLVRKFLLNLITRLDAHSSRFFALSICSNSFTTLILCVYLPTNYGTALSDNLFREALAEIRGFLNSCQYDNVVIAGDFNVDFNHSSNPLVNLKSFMSELNLCIVDLTSSEIDFTYERDDGMVRSWLDHVLTLSHFSACISNTRCVHSSCNLSDHCPQSFSISFNHCMGIRDALQSVSTSESSGSHAQNLTDWTRVTALNVKRYHKSILNSLPHISPELTECCTTSCTTHISAIDSVCNEFLSALSFSANLHLPKRSHRHKAVPGWNDLMKPFKDSAAFWNKLWVEAECPSTGILFDLRKHTKKEYKYAVRRAKYRRNHTIRKKTASTLGRKDKASFWKEVKKSSVLPHVDLLSVLWLMGSPLLATSVNFFVRN